MGWCTGDQCAAGCKAAVQLAEQGSPVLDVVQDQRGHRYVDLACGHDFQRLFQVGYLDAGAPVQPLPPERDKPRFAVQREDVGSPAGELRSEHPARAAELQNASV